MQKNGTGHDDQSLSNVPKSELFWSNILALIRI